MKNKKILISLLIFIALLLFSNTCMAGDLDVINQYTITVEPRQNGTLDMTYHLEWKVIDSTSEGPLEWIKIGIPNANVSNITAISNNIKKISYYKDGGDYIRIDFKKSYEEGSVLDIDFKFNQSHMYTLTSGSCKYSFTPGWFDEINVKKLIIRWKTDDIIKYSPKASTSGGYYVWTKNNLLKGNKYTINVSYLSDAFETDKSMQFSNATITTNDDTNIFKNRLILLIAALLGIGLLSTIIALFSGGGYSSHSGWGYNSHDDWYDDDDDTWSSSSSSCVSSCACACACAGGGRAGCSKKDLYGTNVRTQKLNKILNS